MYKGPERSGLGLASTAGAWIALARSVVVLALALVALGEAAGAGPGEAAACETRSMRVTFYTCAEGFSHCLTKRGHQPIPFRTVAVGDRGLLGRWLYVEDLGGWVLAADTGAALKKNSIDVFMGEGRMAPYARRLGVQHWNVLVCASVRPTTNQEAVASTQASADTKAASDTRVASLGGPEPARPAASAAAPVH